MNEMSNDNDYPFIIKTSSFVPKNITLALLVYMSWLINVYESSPWYMYFLWDAV